jgi:hypothetical protein
MKDDMAKLCSIHGRNMECIPNLNSKYYGNREFGIPRLNGRTVKIQLH